MVVVSNTEADYLLGTAVTSTRVADPPPTARIASVAPAFVTDAAPALLADWLAYFEPDIVLLTGADPAPRAANTLRRHLSADTTLYHPAGQEPLTGPKRINGVQFVFAPTTEILSQIAAAERTALDTDAQTFVVSGLLKLDIDTTTLSTTLVGESAYRRALTPAHLTGTYSHISAQLPVAYRHEWDGLRILGGGADAGIGDTPLVALDCRADGRVFTRSLQQSQLGLHALDRVGDKRRAKLNAAGFDSREAIAAAVPRVLADLPGIGMATAQRIHASARAIANDEIVRLSDEPLPSGAPIYIDIETDGLTPTITWLIGVLDSTDGTYRSFLQRDPDKPGQAIADFMAWYTATASHRPLVAYRGWGFDFEVLHDHIVEYCPQYEDAWTSTYRFDPYAWAVEQGHAILPGRTNTLADVAGALGYDRTGDDLTGAAVARAYRQWMQARTPDVEPDWDRYVSYCEDDVRGLAVIYTALQESSRLASPDDASRDSTDTTQQTLSDW